MTGLRLRVYVDGEQVAEDWIGRPGDSQQTGEQLAIRHRDLCTAAADAGKVWLVELYDPSEPEESAYARFGSDVSGMVLPVALVQFTDDPRLYRFTGDPSPN